MIAAVYASGEVPEVGDVVECVDNSCGEEGTQLVVQGFSEWDYLLVGLPSDGWYASRFKLIRRKQEPAMSGAVVKGPPPKDCLAAWYRHSHGDWNLYASPVVKWSEDIIEHVPIDIGVKPELPPAPIALPRRFRAKGKTTDMQVSGVLLHHGMHVWSNREVWNYANTTDVHSHLKDINFIDDPA